MTDSTQPVRWINRSQRTYPPAYYKTPYAYMFGRALGVLAARGHKEEADALEAELQVLLAGPKAEATR